MKSENIAVLGVPFDGYSTYLRGAAKAPGKILESLHCDSSNLWTENGIDLGGRTDWETVGDVDIKDDKTAFSKIEDRVGSLLKDKSRVITLGGDHSITYPIVRAYAGAYPELNILHLDAHPDLYEELGGIRHSHACPFARIMENNLASKLVQAGIRTLNGHQKEQAERFKVEIIDMKNIESAMDLSFDGPVYLSIDLDCLDPAFAPGVSHHEPGGMSTRQVLTLIQTLDADLVGADIVEYNPDRDLNGVTGMVAAKLLKEILARMMENN